MKTSHILITSNEPDYELLDSGEGEKLERFGKIVLSRPDPQALWKKNDPMRWKNVDGYFSREEKGSNWELKLGTPDKWEIGFGGLKFWIKPTTFKHVGLFPEQRENWSWMRERIGEGLKGWKGEGEAQGPQILNLFAYTGGATLAAAQAGANVVHVDGSKVAVNWARENAELSGLTAKPVRWILEDVPTFVKREIKREKKYDGIIMDPPSFGHGPDSQLWKIEDSFLSLIDDCMQLLSDKPLFFLINGYSAGYSAIAYENNLLALKKKFGGTVEIGELALEEGRSQDGRLLPAGIFARWSR
ncbi:MAG: class I SAM-dependent methyltransferase [Patescibacteria group bacterium]